MASMPSKKGTISMKLYHLIHSRTALVMACGAALAVGFVTFGAKADEWDKKTVLTVNQPIQVRDTLLQPGQYVFKLMRSDSDRHIVQIFNANESHIINTILAVPKERMEPTGSSQFTFYETPAGKARALRAWFYPGDLVGQEFPYPKHLRDVAMNTTAENTTTTTTTNTQEAQPAPPPAQTMTEEQSTATEQATQPTETAQSTPPPPPPAEQPPAAAPPPAPDTEANRSAELPKTASPYPLIGLAGLALIGLSGLLRIKRTA